MSTINPPAKGVWGRVRLPPMGGLQYVYWEFGVVQWCTTPPSGHPSIGGEFFRFFRINSLSNLAIQFLIEDLVSQLRFGAATGLLHHLAHKEA
jgi:hypothetical protein